MYVGDMTLEEAWQWESALAREIGVLDHRTERHKQLRMDYEDVAGRIRELSA